MSYKKIRSLAVDAQGTAYTPNLKSTTDANNEHTPHVNVDNVANGALPCITPGASAKVAYDGSAASGAIAADVVRLVASTDCHVAFGAVPVAAADGTCVFLPANVPEYFRITSGHKVAAIKDAVAGNLFITAAA